MNVPQGRLLRSRVVDDPGVVLTAALDQSLSGYAVLEPQDAILFDDGARGVVTFDDGVPVLVYRDLRRVTRGAKPTSGFTFTALGDDSLTWTA